MKATRCRASASALLIVAVAALGAVVSSASAVERPAKELLEAQLGWEVGQSQTNICFALIESCAGGGISAEPGGFNWPEGIAAGPGPEHYVYVADKINGRVQVFTSAGAFVEMFGWDVNRTKVEEGATQQQDDVCTATEIAGAGVRCQSGQAVAGGPAGEIESPTSIAIDQESGDLYVWDVSQHRIDKYAADGEFLLMIGSEVNKKGGNICGSSEEVECRSGKSSAAGSQVAGAFKLSSDRGDLLAVGPKDTLFVGDEGRVQEFEDDLHVRDISVRVKYVEALALGAMGELYVMGGNRESEDSPTIEEYAATGAEVITKCTIAEPTCWPLTLAPVRKYKTPGQGGVIRFVVNALATNGIGQLAVTTEEVFEDAAGDSPEPSYHGLLLSGLNGEELTGFSVGAVPYSVTALAFGTAEASGGYPLYIAGFARTRITFFDPVSTAALSTTPSPCAESGEAETDVAMTCALSGAVNPWGVPDTDSWFAWGPTAALGTQTSRQTVCSLACGEVPVALHESVAGLRPNQTIYYEVMGEDENVKAPEALTSKLTSLQTPVVPPRVGEPNVESVGASTAVVQAEVNPENTNTSYRFLYGSCASGLVGCARSVSSQTETSGAYGTLATTEELTHLQPGTVYRFALLAENEDGQITTGPEGTFTTGAAPLPSATAMAASDVTSTGAVIAGSVNANGQTTAYAFELGVYEGANTSYGVVASASIAPSRSPVAEHVSVSGLQAGTTYAYRVKVENPYGQATSAAATFTTAGAAAVLGVPPTPDLLGVPKIAFPVQAGRPLKLKCGRGYRPARRGGCAKVKRGGKHRRHRAGRSTTSSAGNRQRH